MSDELKGDRKLVARKLFKLRVHESSGTAYQQLFEMVMGYAEPGFVPIKPYGCFGDRKNDGYVQSTGTYHQVYAPEDSNSSRTAVAAARKARDDFAGLLEAWDTDTPIQSYQFVFNDRYHGSPPIVEEALAGIRNENGIDASVMLARHLEDLALKLDYDQLVDVLGSPVPAPDLLPDVDFGVVGEVVNHLLATKAPFTPESLRTPDFGEKIAFNELSATVAAHLRFGAFQTEAVDDFFSRNSDFAKQTLRDHLSGLYVGSRKRFGEVVDTDRADFVFFDLLNEMIPPGRRTGDRAHAHAQEAAIVVMAYYFEACDVFEDPDVAAS